MTETTDVLLRRCLKQVSPFSRSVNSLLEEFDRNPVDLKSVCRKIESDPVLTLSILRLANSAFYGFPRKIDNAQDAVVLLGLHSVLQIIISFSLLKAFPDHQQCAINNRALWQHSLAVAATARVLARQIGLDEDLAFTAGMLHDIGVFVLAHGLGADYQPVIAHRQDRGCRLEDAERQLLATDHQQIGALAIEQWHLPTALVCIVRDCNKRLDLAPEHPMTDVIQLANILVKGLQLAEEINPLIIDMSPETLTRLALDLPTLASLLPEIEAISRDMIDCFLN